MWITIGSLLWGRGENEMDGTYKVVDNYSLGKGRMRFFMFVLHLSTRPDHPFEATLGEKC